MLIVYRAQNITIGMDAVTHLMVTSLVCCLCVGIKGDGRVQESTFTGPTGWAACGQSRYDIIFTQNLEKHTNEIDFT